MSRTARYAPGGMVYHVLNRGVGRRTLFDKDGDLAAFMQQMTNMHVKRWKEHRHEIGYGHLYQERYKSFPVETDDYFYQLVRYVERNALRANLAPCAEWGLSRACAAPSARIRPSRFSRRGHCPARATGCGS